MRKRIRRVQIMAGDDGRSSSGEPGFLHLIWGRLRLHAEPPALKGNRGSVSPSLTSDPGHYQSAGLFSSTGSLMPGSFITPRLLLLLLELQWPVTKPIYEVGKESPIRSLKLINKYWSVPLRFPGDVTSDKLLRQLQLSSFTGHVVVSLGEQSLSSCVPAGYHHPRSATSHGDIRFWSGMDLPPSRWWDGGGGFPWIPSLNPL